MLKEVLQLYAGSFRELQKIKVSNIMIQLQLQMKHLNQNIIENESFFIQQEKNLDKEFVETLIFKFEKSMKRLVWYEKNLQEYAYIYEFLMDKFDSDKSLIR